MPLEKSDPLLQVEGYLSFTAFLAPFPISHVVIPEDLNEIVLGEGLTFRVSECVLSSEWPKMSPLLGRLGPKTLVAFKRVKTSAAVVVSSEMNTFQSVCLELRVLLHAPLRTNENIINILGIGWENRISLTGVKVLSPLLIVEHATHGNLQDYQNAHKMSWVEKRLLCIDIALGLQVLHECGIVHGDVKSENVLLFPHDKRRVIAKLSDFGCSLGDSDGDHGARVLLGGTPMWAAPEISSGPILQDLATMSDVYSFGLLAWRLSIDGHNPFISSMVFDIEAQSDYDIEEVYRQVQNCKVKDNFMSICVEHAQFLKQNTIPLEQIMEATLLSDPASRKDMTGILSLFGQVDM